MTNKLLLLFAVLLITTTMSFAQTSDSSTSKPYKFKSRHRSKADSAMVYVSFIVEKTGEITDVKIHKTVCEGCRDKLMNEIMAESVRVVKLFPNWKPAERRTKYILPLRFSLEDL